MWSHPRKMRFGDLPGDEIVVSPPSSIVEPLLLLYVMTIRTYIHTGKKERCEYEWPSRIAEYGSTGYGCHFCSWSIEQRKLIFPCPRLHLRIWSRETGLAVPSRFSLLILHTHAEAGRTDLSMHQDSTF